MCLRRPICSKASNILGFVESRAQSQAETKVWFEVGCVLFCRTSLWLLHQNILDELAHASHEVFAIWFALMGPGSEAFLDVAFWPQKRQINAFFQKSSLAGALPIFVALPWSSVVKGESDWLCSSCFVVKLSGPPASSDAVLSRSNGGYHGGATPTHCRRKKNELGYSLECEPCKTILFCVFLNSLCEVFLINH